MKKKFDLSKIGFVLLNTVTIFLVSATEIFSQGSQTTAVEDNTWWYITLFILVSGLAGAIMWMVKSKKAENEKSFKDNASHKKKDVMWENNSVDASKEMEWLRKNQKLIDKKRKKAPARKARENIADPAQEEENILNIPGEAPVNEEYLPVFNFKKIVPARPFAPLPLSNDESLLNAIEQAHDEYEEDEEIRDLAVRILTAFKTRNSVESLSQVALYDLSSSLRSKAVLTLTEFDHESVFEIILLACADPTREVRAAAARGLTRLSFDRADAWARIFESGEKGRMRQAARAAIESGFVERSFDRLVHPDRQYAYEAFVLLSLLVKSGETEPIFTALKNHKNKHVQLAILHILKVTQSEEALSELSERAERNEFYGDLKIEVDKTVEEFSLAAV
jgi:hypothetical protein